MTEDPDSVNRRDPGSALAAEAVRRCRKLMEDYFPSSRHSSTAVKLAACLTEASTVWSASGGAILTGAPAGRNLSLSTGRGNAPREMDVTVGDGTIASRCFTRGRHEVVPDLSAGSLSMPEGIDAGSAACVAVKSGTSVWGVLLLWSDAVGHFSEGDLDALSMFGYYVAMLLEFDELGEKLGEHLIVDPLTGLHNRRQFETRLQLEAQRAQRYALNVSLVVIDVDGMGEYNDSCGHMMGNLLLSDVASVIENGTREVDFVARIGGDEFAAILPETNRLGAVKLADRLRNEVASYPFPVPEGRSEASITVSIGIASYPGCAASGDELLSNAYLALDVARREGPGSIKLWEKD